MVYNKRWKYECIWIILDKCRKKISWGWKDRGLNFANKICFRRRDYWHSAYTPQIGVGECIRQKLWEDMYELIEGVPNG